MITKGEETSSTVALHNGVALLRLLACEGPQTVEELAGRAAMRLDTTARLLQTLELHGYVETSRFAGRYQPGAMTRQLSAAFLRDLPICELARPLLRGFADKYGAIASLLTADGDQALALLVCRGPARDAATGRIGPMLPMTGSAGGHVLLLIATSDSDSPVSPYGAGEDGQRLARRMDESLAFFRQNGCFRMAHDELDVVSFGAPLYLGNATLALQAVVPCAAAGAETTPAIVRDLQAAAEIIQQRSAVTGARYLDD